MRQYGPPEYPPPTTIPSKPFNSYIIDCLHSYTYVWPINGRPFWFYPTRVEYGEFLVIGGLEVTGHSMDLVQNMLMRWHAIPFLLFTKAILK